VTGRSEEEAREKASKKFAVSADKIQLKQGETHSIGTLKRFQEFWARLDKHHLRSFAPTANKCLFDHILNKLSNSYY